MDRETNRSLLQSSNDLGILDPQGRLKALSDYGNAVDIDFGIPPRRYYRSGLEMVRMANVYLEEGSLENAFILYMKFMTLLSQINRLFIEKIRLHPEFKSVSATDRAVNAQKLREVLPIAEKLKTRLLDQYTREYNRYNEEKKRREAKELENERKKKEAPEFKPKSSAMIALEDNAVGPSKSPAPIILIPPPLTENIHYPDSLETVKTYVPKPVSLDIPPAVSLPTKPSVDRSTKPLSLLSPSIHSKLGLRDVIIPSKLMNKFLVLAQRNTEQNVETCGILAGKLEHDQLIITHLLVPKQTGTPDSCTTQNEEEIFDYQDQHDLITLGWIHTHPSQTAFLSSVDLHTHCSYQRMMPEALAIVCAPRYNENGFFMLTPNYGLDYIANCRQSGFHPHPTEPPLFTAAEHSKLNNWANVEVVDLRRAAKVIRENTDFTQRKDENN